MEWSLRLTIFIVIVIGGDVSRGECRGDRHPIDSAHHNDNSKINKFIFLSSVECVEWMRASTFHDGTETARDHIIQWIWRQLIFARMKFIIRFCHLAHVRIRVTMMFFFLCCGGDKTNMYLMSGIKFVGAQAVVGWTRTGADGEYDRFAHYPHATHTHTFTHRVWATHKNINLQHPSSVITWCHKICLSKRLLLFLLRTIHEIIIIYFCPCTNRQFAVRLLYLL